MHELILRLKCDKPDAVKSSLEPDIKNGPDSITELSTGDGFIEIKVRNKKLSHLKAIINSYISIVSMINEVESNDGEHE